MTMDQLREQATKEYVRRVKTHRNLVTTAGRYPMDAGKLPYIWKDIQDKLQITRGSSVLDIGCGYGGITQRCIRQAVREDWKLTMIDIPEVIQAVRQDLLRPRHSRSVQLLAGIFPDDIPVAWKHSSYRFDRILIYSVLHYTSRPMSMIDAAVRLLAPGGRLLFGDIPNLSKKGRFLASESGRRFDAAYKKIPVQKAPVYKDHHQFVREVRAKSASPLVDAFLLSVIGRYRNDGYDAFLLPQPESLPMCYSREDLLICRHA